VEFRPDDDTAAVAALARDVLTRAPEPSGASPRERDAWAWAALAKSDLLGVAAPSDSGGAGLGVEAVAEILTVVGRWALIVPALPTLALGLLPVVRHGTDEQQRRLLPGVIAGNDLLTAAISEPGAPLTTTPAATATEVDGGWRLDGHKTAVGWADEAVAVLVTATGPTGPAVFLLDPRSPGVTLHPAPTSSGTPEFSLTLAGATVPADAILGDGAAAGLVDLARAGAAALADGALAGALELTCEHLRTRHQFGRPLAAFQAVAQQIADVYIAGRTLHLAALSAAWRTGAGDGGAAGAVAGYWLATETLPAIRTCHHLHGGIGLDVTYPLHRYYSLLKDLNRLVGGAAAAGRALVATTRSTAVPGTGATAGTVEGGRYLALTAAQESLRDELRGYFEQLMTADERVAMRVTRHGAVFREVVRRMGRDGRLGVGWPTEFGGRGFGPIEQHLFVNESSRADVQLPSVTLQTVGPTLQRFGTDEQKREFLPKILAGDVHFAIGYSEPEAGTDLAALRTTAVREGDHYLVNGQKMFTTGGHDADYIWLAVRTDPAAPKHKGISILIVDTRDPGFSWTPIITADGAHHVNATYYSDVKVPVSMLVGAENEGWKLITTQLNHERVMLGPSGRIGAIADKFDAWIAAHHVAAEPDVIAARAAIAAAEQVNELMNWQVAAGDEVSVADASATKIFGSERIQTLGALVEETVAAHADPAEPVTAELLDWLDNQSKRNLVLTFGGGVNEIQRELIATMGLHLPRVPR
jgi:alkylation response protein AidB-like acyl-CoA dehydrogenase